MVSQHATILDSNNAEIEEMESDSSQPIAVTLPNSERLQVGSDGLGTYQIDISWPLGWKDRQPSSNKPAPILYMTDGNATFLTATEAARRNAALDHFQGGGIIVAIGYPLQDTLFDLTRRQRDFKPTGKDAADAGHADAFLELIQTAVRPKVKARFPNVTISREALYGHSLGGLFALHTLFTRPRTFDCYLVSSPSIWWNDKYILSEAEHFLNNTLDDDLSTQPTLLLLWASLERHPRQGIHESVEEFEARKQVEAGQRMADNALDLYEMLRDCKSFAHVSKVEFEGEDHLTVVASSINRSVTEFFEQWPSSV